MLVVQKIVWCERIVADGQDSWSLTVYIDLQPDRDIKNKTAFVCETVIVASLSSLVI